MLEHAATLDPTAANAFFALDIGAILIVTMAMAVAISGVSTALLDTRPKLEEQIAKYDKNITDLKEILKQQREKLQSRGWIRRKAVYRPDVPSSHIEGYGYCHIYQAAQPLLRVEV